MTKTAHELRQAVVAEMTNDLVLRLASRSEKDASAILDRCVALFTVEAGEAIGGGERGQAIAREVVMDAANRAVAILRTLPTAGGSA